MTSVIMISLIMVYRETIWLQGQNNNVECRYETSVVSRGLTTAFTTAIDFYMTIIWKQVGPMSETYAISISIFG